MSYKNLRDGGVKRLTDGAFIPADSENADYQQFIAWQSAGNIPAAADPEPLRVASPTIKDVIAVLSDEQRAALDSRVNARAEP